METVNRTLSPEQLKKLQKAGILGLDPEDIIFFVPKIFREDPELFPKNMWPVYKLKPLTGIQSAKMEGKTGHLEYKKDGDEEKSQWISTNGPLRIETLKTHIIGWNDNHRDKKGNSIPFSHNNGAVSNKSLETLKQALQIELFNAINDGSDATEEELEGLEF